MPTKGPARVLVVALAFVLLPALGLSLLPAMTVVAHHEPTTQDVLDVATARPWNMQCEPGSGDQQDCIGFFGSDFPSQAFITPADGPLEEVVTEADAFNNDFWNMSTNDRDFMIALHSVGCLDSNAVAGFVDDAVAAMANPSSGVTSYGPETVGECSMIGRLFPSPQGGSGTWSFTSTTLASAFSPTPSPTPTATPRVTPRPTPRATLGPTATPKPTAKPTAKPPAGPTAVPAATSTSESESPSATESASASAWATLDAETPEQTVAGITFSPEPSVAPPAAAGDDGGWARSVPVAKDVSTDPQTLAGSALAAMLLLLAMGFIGELFNNTVETNYDRISGWWQKSWLGRAGKAFSGIWGGGS